MCSKAFRKWSLAFALGSSACAAPPPQPVPPSPEPQAAPASPVMNAQTASGPTPQSPESSAAPPRVAASATSPDSGEGQAAVRAWLALTDAEKYGESWRAAAELFQSAVSEEAWGRSLGNVRRPLGQVLTRTLKTATQKTSLPGAPDGKYVLVQFDTVFTNKAAAVETVTAMQAADRTWKVAAYFVR